MNIKYNYDFSVFYKEDQLSYYLLGVFMTDGCVYKTGTNRYACQISSKDMDWLNDIKNKIGNNLQLYKFGENYYGIRIIRNELAQWLIGKGCVPRKTLTIKMPNIPQQYIPDFLRGCIDGDGSIGTYTYEGHGTSRKCYLISASEQLLIEIQNYLKDQNIKSTIIEKKQKEPVIVNGKSIIQKHKCYALTTQAINTYKLLKLIYYPNHILSLNRKNQKAQEIINFYETEEIIDKRKIPIYNKGCKIVWPENEVLLDMISKSNIEQLSKILGVHPTSIRHRLQTRGLYYLVKKANIKILPEQREQIIKDFANGLYSRKELAKIYNVSKTTIIDIINNKY